MGLEVDLVVAVIDRGSCHVVLILLHGWIIAPVALAAVAIHT